ncbi:ABC transporter ATP-binding protein [Roseomonas sp. BN140053]|uniref:ABC transporter ATP-binding protein n=1 Tax=Roseomonas sp. BN140053 TaxID=3391898 RepID=UPI0039EAF97E
MAGTWPAAPDAASPVAASGLAAGAGRTGAEGAAPLLAVDGLRTCFRTELGVVSAVRDASFRVERGQTLAIVGESGSGKSVTSLSILRLLTEPAGFIAAGSIRLRCKDGAVRDLATLDEASMCRLRGRDLAMIFQEPMTSLNPAHRIGDQIAEAILLHEDVSRAEARRRVRALLERVEIPDPARRMNSYPHQLSGGMRQRVMIAMALACAPALLIADEPTTALDVTVQAQVLALMRRLQAEEGMSILFITHNLGVVAEMASRVAVMYGGTVVEECDAAAVFRAPRHPYTVGLLRSLPRLGAEEDATGRPRRLLSIPGSVPSPLRPPPGCPFAPRCEHRVDACDAALPPLAEAEPGHRTRCIRWQEVCA